MSLESPLLLLLAPLAILPWLITNTQKVIVSDAFIPHDPLSKGIARTLNTLGSAVILSLVIVVSGPHIPEYAKDHVATGAEFVILLDRSRSMDQPFAVENSAQKVNRDLSKSKRHTAVKHLEEFVKRRSDERWGFVMFSNKVMPLIPLTENKDVVLATIQASGLGKGMSETNLAQSLLQAGDYFYGEKYKGSRVVLLVSDGGEKFSEEEEARISQIFQENSLTLYWIYLKSIHDFSLEKSSGEPIAWNELPERKLHKFFLNMQIPYKVFEADTDSEFSNAFLEINEDQSHSIIVSEIQPKESKARIFLTIAFISLLPLVLVKLYALLGMKPKVSS
ncbi:vWA domain-containing protein [Methylophaga sp.]|uniref:vWA domain-containing protein n=1 Tax=Methylophaga sp. TaxID=2024840 RepID=UPI003F6A10C4